MEQSRTRDFLHTAGFVDETGENGVSQIPLSKTAILVNILSEINSTLVQFASDKEGQRSGITSPMLARDPTMSGDPNESYTSLYSKLSTNMRRVPETSGFAHKATWSIFQKDKCERFLQRLGQYNDFLYELLDAQQMRNLRDQQHQRNLQLVQMRESLDDIRQLTEAAYASNRRRGQSGIWQHAIDEELENLAQFKALYISLIQHNTSEAGNHMIAPSKIYLTALESDQLHYAQAIFTSEDGEEKEVWINWQSTEVPDDNSASSAVEELAILLAAPKPDEFCILTCVGYSVLQRGEEEARLALIFEKPHGIDPEAQPTSLFHALDSCTKPALTHRIALAHKLAQCLLYLHTVNWLHKAFRSSNVLFFPLPNHQLDIRSPYITGFDNSRRSRFNEVTTDVPRVGRMEVYRHPDTQIDGPMLPYRKTFDIYSLGLVLVEIALWKPLVSIMGIQETVDQSRKATSSIRDRWLISEPHLLRALRAEVGEKYTDAIETCLKGRDAFGIDRPDLETSVDTGMKIQRGFIANVIRLLAEIVV